MLEINTFLRKADGSFVLVEACEELPSDPDYVEGAIEILVGGREIVGKREWDYVDQLWAYLATMLKEFKNVDRAATYYPDQPIELSFERNGNRVRITSKVGEDQRSGVVDEKELLAVLRSAGIAFLDRMTVLNRSEAQEYSVARAELSS